jgi:hypothetical protein
MRHARHLVVAAALFATGCAGSPPQREMVGYVPPTSPPTPPARTLVQGPPDAIWAGLREHFGKAPYEIERADQAEGLLVARFRGDPASFLDCGSIVTHDGQQLGQVSGALQNVALDYKLGREQVVLKRDLQLDGRVVVTLEQQPNGTLVKADTTYVVTKVVDFEDAAGRLRRGSRESVNFTSGKRGAFDKGTVCQSNGSFEVAMLDDLPTTLASRPITQTDLPAVTTSEPLAGGPAVAGLEPAPLDSPPAGFQPPPEAAEIEAALDSSPPSPAASGGASAASTALGGAAGAAVVGAGAGADPDTVIAGLEPTSPTPAAEPAPGEIVDRATSAILASLDCTGIEWQFCRVLTDTTAYRKANIERGLGLTIDTADGRTTLAEGTELAINIELPRYDSYLHLGYLRRDGQVAHLISTSELWPSDLGSYVEDTGVAVGAPYGLSMVIAVATPSPLFDTPRPAFESAEDYLRTLEERLATLNAANGADQIAVTHLFINTQATPVAASQ